MTPHSIRKTGGRELGGFDLSGREIRRICNYLVGCRLERHTFVFSQTTARDGFLESGRNYSIIEQNSQAMLIVRDDIRAVVNNLFALRVVIRGQDRAWSCLSKRLKPFPVPLLLNSELKYSEKKISLLWRCLTERLLQ